MNQNFHRLTLKLANKSLASMPKPQEINDVRCNNSHNFWKIEPVYNILATVGVKFRNEFILKCRLIFIRETEVVLRNGEKS